MGNTSDPSRRDFIRTAGVGGVGFYLLSTVGGVGLARAGAVPAAPGLSDPAMQPLFANPVPNAVDPAFSYPAKAGTKYDIEVGPTVQQTGLVDPATGVPLSTPVFGYGSMGAYSWPGADDLRHQGPAHRGQVEEQAAGPGDRRTAAAPAAGGYQSPLVLQSAGLEQLLDRQEWRAHHHPPPRRSLRLPV